MTISGFLESLSTRTRSKETIRAYRRDLSRFEAFCIEKGLGVDQVKPTTIADFLKYLEENKGRTRSASLAPSTISRMLSVVSEYYEWLRDVSDGTIQNPVGRVKRPKVRNEKPRAADDNVLATLVDGITNVRDKAIVLLFLYSGLRLDELRQLNKTTITLRRQKLPDGSFGYFGTGEVTGKGSKTRTFMVGPKAMEAVRIYIARFRMNDNQPALFLSSRQERFSSRGIQQILYRWCNKVGIPRLHVHQLRHSFATRSVNGGMSSVVLQELMGHVNPATTQRYFTIRPERLAREYHATMEFVRAGSPV